MVYDREIKRLRHCEYKDFAILIDRKTKFEVFQKTFSEFGIPLSTEKESGLSDSDVILTFQSLVRLYEMQRDHIRDEHFRHAFFSVARSFLFRFSDQRLLDIDRDKAYENTDILVKINRVIENKKNHPLSEILSSLIDSFDFFENLLLIGNIEENRRKIQGLIDIAQSLEQIGYGINEFVEYFDDLANFDVSLSVPASKSVDDCVRLMSIHKSKGLEFPIIYFAGNTNRFNEESFTSSFLADSTFGIILPIIDQFEANNIYHYLVKQKEHRATISEQVRLLYVALTRTKEKMIVLLPESNPDEPDIYHLDSASSFFDFFRYSRTEEDIIKKVSLNGIKKEPKDRKSQDLQVILKKNGIRFTSIQHVRASKQSLGKVDRKVLDFGSRLHAILEIVDFRTKDLSFVRDQSQQKMVKKILDLPLFESLETCQIFKEYEFIDQERNTRGIIDLLLVFPTYTTIIDYKLKNLDDDAYNVQLQTYANYVKKAFSRDTRCYLLSVLTGEMKKVELQ